MDKKALLKKFFDNNCNAEEAIIVEQWIKDEPALLDEMLPMSEWETYERNEKSNELLQQLLWSTIERETIKTSSIFKIWKRMAAEASIVFLFGFSIFFYLQKENLETKNDSNLISSAVPSLQVVANNTDKINTIALADGSKVELHPQSKISYPIDFKNRRAIELTGKAIFIVAKDRVHPFTVSSGSYSTTALGTTFLVDAGQSHINVQLYEGKVLVRALHGGSTMKPTYLSPGEQFMIDLNSGHYLVSTLIKGNNDKNSHAALSQNLKLKKSGLQFYKIPLIQVFSELEINYGKQIVYFEKDIQNKYFTGSFEYGQSLLEILKLIGAVNGFDIVEKRGIMEVKIDKTHNGNTLKNSKEIENDFKLDSISMDITNFDAHGEKHYRQISLFKLFKELENIYGLSIVCYNMDMHNKYFTGTLSNNDDIETVLNVIAQMNALKVLKETNGFIVTQ